MLRLGRPRRGTRGPGRPESGAAEGVRRQAVWCGIPRRAAGRRCCAASARPARSGTGLRLRLRLTDAPELAELPWEFLYDPRLNRFLAQSRRTPLVRYLDLPDPPQPLSVDGPLRLLVMISKPQPTIPELDVEREWSLLTRCAGRRSKAKAR